MKNIETTLIKLKNCNLHKSKFIYLPFTKVSYKLLQILQFYGYIELVYSIKNIILVVYLTKLINFKKFKYNNKQSHYPVSFLKKYINYNYLTIISTSKGLFSISKSLYLKKGGQCMFIIW